MRLIILCQLILTCLATHAQDDFYLTGRPAHTIERADALSSGERRVQELLQEGQFHEFNPNTSLQELKNGPTVPSARCNTEEVQECHYKNPQTWAEPRHYDFCNNFGLDYFYRLTETTETHTYKEHRYRRPQWNERSSLIALSWVVLEAGWDIKRQRHYNNYWGIGGTAHFHKFSNFDEGLAFQLNHLKHGIGVPGENHPGWPEAIELFEGTNNFKGEELNKALRSGPHCSTGYPYNNDRTAGVCMDYAKQIMKNILPVLLKMCLYTFENERRSTPTTNKSYIYSSNFTPSMETRKQKAFNRLKSFATRNYPATFCQ